MPTNLRRFIALGAAGAGCDPTDFVVQFARTTSVPGADPMPKAAHIPNPQRAALVISSYDTDSLVAIDQHNIVGR